MSKNLEYKLLSNDIHYIKWFNNSRDTVSEGITIYQQINKTLHLGEIVRVLIDLRESGTPPINMLSNATRDVDLHSNISYRTAYLSDDRILPILMNNYAIITRLDGCRQFFASDEEAKAIDWLLNI